MTEQEIQDLGPAFAAYLARFRPDLGDIANVAHLRNYCRGLLADLPRKRVEPIALAAGTSVRTLQEFLRRATGTRRPFATGPSATWRPPPPRFPPTRPGPSG